MIWMPASLIAALASPPSWGASDAATPAPHPSLSQSIASGHSIRPSPASLSVATQAAGTHAVPLINNAQSAAAAPSAASSRTAEIKPTPAAVTEQQRVISYLSAAIAWYRQLNAERGLVEEPSETVYLTADQEMAQEVINLAFNYADAQSALLTRFGSGQPAASAAKQQGPGVALESHLAEARAAMATLQAQIKDLSTRQRAAPRRQRDSITRQLVAAQAEQQLAQSRVDFLTTMAEFEQGNSPVLQSNTLQAQIEALRHSLRPEEQSKAPLKAAGSVSTALAEPTGLVGLVQHLLDLHTRMTAIEQRQDDTQSFIKISVRTRAALEQELKSLDDTAQKLTQLSLTDDTTNIADRKKQFEQLIAQRKLLGTALVALSKQNLLLQRYTDNLGQWHEQVGRHNSETLHALLVRLGGLALVGFLIAALSFIWRRLTFRYVEDAARRRQILKVRNVTIVILVIIVLLFNFTSELGALATVLGFAAAGIAVALQDVIMSVAGYFRLAGRFGIKRGDRVELQGVRGEVVELGLTKLTLLEMGGEGIQSGPTGRLVMIPNSSVFRDKFLNHPGRSMIIWRELRFMLAPDCDFRVVEKQLLEVVEAVFARYRDSARSQLQQMERDLDTTVDSGRPQSRVHLRPDGLQITLRFPVDVRSEVQVVDEISRRLLDYIASNPQLRFVPSGAPNIQMIAAAPEAAAPDAADPNHTQSDAPQSTPAPRTQS